MERRCNLELGKVVQMIVWVHSIGSSSVNRINFPFNLVKNLQTKNFD